MDRAARSVNFRSCSLTTLKKNYSSGGANINIVTYSVNVRLKFYSTEGTTIHDATYIIITE